MNILKKHHQKIYRVLRGCIYLLIPVVLFVLITSRTGIIYGLRTFTVLTGSMVPEIPIGSMVFTVPQSVYRRGDIITFNRGNITITHRIVSMKQGKFQTKGDANTIADPQLVQVSDVIGKDYFILPYIGRFTEFLKTIFGFTLCIVLPVLLYIAFELHAIKKEIEKQVEARVRKQYEKEA